MSSRSSMDRAPPGVREVLGSIPDGNSDFFFVSGWCHVDQIHLSHFVTELKIPHLYLLIIILVNIANLFSVIFFTRLLGRLMDWLIDWLIDWNVFFLRLDCLVNQTHFHLKDWAPGLVLKTRSKQLGYGLLLKTVSLDNVIREFSSA